MCGRFFVDAKNREIDRLLECLPPDSPPVKLGEVFPTDAALVLCGENGEIAARAMFWGFPRWNAKGVVFNARAESALEKPFFRNSLLERPLAVPVSGFYEWKGAPGQKCKDKYLFLGEAPVFYLAGFWNTFTEADVSRRCFTILTTAANESILPFHERMPVLLHAYEAPLWLEGKDRENFMRRIPFAVRAEKSGRSGLV